MTGASSPLLLQNQPKIVVTVAIVRLEDQRQSILGDGAIEISLSGEQRRQIVMGIGVAGLQPQCLFEFGDRCVWVEVQ
jgi:hypothetical protein